MKPFTATASSPLASPKLRPLRVLVIEDCEADASLMLQQLEAEGFDPHWVRVETEEEFQAKLNPQFDVILSDHTLPAFSAPRALELLREMDWDVPFIIVSGTIHEETAVNAMRRGAADYVWKDRLARLGPAVKHAVEQRRLGRERRQTDEELRSTHLRMRQLMEHSPAVMYALKVQGNNVSPDFVSENITALSGFTVSEALRPRWWEEGLHPDDRHLGIAGVSETFIKGTSNMEYRFRHKDGTYRWVEDKRRLIRDAFEQPKEMVGVWTDISERKKAAEVLSRAFERERNARRTAATRDLSVGVIGAVLLFVLAYWFNFFVGPLELIVKHKDAPLNGFIGTLFVFSPLPLIFGYRRWREAEKFFIERHASAIGGQNLSFDRVRELRSKAVKELVVFAIAAAALTVFSDYYGIFERPFALLWRYHHTVWDELIGTVVVLMISVVPAAAVFAGRRWFEMKSEAMEEQRTTFAFHALLAELETRVQQSTADLAKTNDALRIKIAEHKRDGDILRESERRFREMLENVGLIAMILDRNGTIIFSNDNLLEVSGWRREEVIGHSWFERFIPGNSVVKDLFLKTFEIGAIPPHYQNPIQTRSGELRDIVWNNTMLRGSDGTFIGTASIGEDVTERNRAERALRESEQRFRSFMQHSPLAGWIVNEEGRICYLSPGYYRMFKVGAPDVAGKLISEIYEPAVAAHYLANNEIVFRERRVVESAESGLRPDGSTGEFMVVKFPMSGPNETTLLGGMAMDVTERKQLEQQFLRAQRMDSIGTLAGGIAHDLNNSLGPILMALDILKLKFPDPDSGEMLDMIRSSAQRGADMVRQVLSFGRGVEGRRHEVQVRHLLRDIEKIARDTFPKSIQVMTDCPSDLQPIMGDPTQLHQLLLNLCINARDAMPNGGNLSLSAENLMFDEHYAALNQEAKPGPCVLIKVKDSGTGIPSEIIEKIFDPFFTTKEVGKGTGLGLYSALGIAKSHGGFIRVVSESGAGTTFQLFIPSHAPGAENPEGPESALPKGNGETVLVVDDETVVREITKQTLETFGYTVLTAADGAEAVGILTSTGAETAVIVTDIAMPVMDGAAMIQVVRRFKPQLPIVVTSGQATKEQLSRMGGLEVKHVLQKPFTAADLLTKLREALAQDD